MGTDLANSPGAQFTFKPLPPPPPPPHACTCARPVPPPSTEGPQRNTLPSRCQPLDLASKTAEELGQPQNSWALNSNIPLETSAAAGVMNRSAEWRVESPAVVHYCGLEGLDKTHFLFKHGSASSTLFRAANQNYPLTSNTVYSPPPRPLPRTTLSRPLFSFSKPYRCCNWKCTALSASAVTVTLALLLT
ncbi:hypothetical protein AALO_G00027080 [Alosa alosa]|uniref:Teneurin N-terminal domain-containing protein n=1 Tax=Alosa alosa TaxID=278164 RepID=A0AAV6HBF0_9TELE|nr:hypothetical protein AALO_G00027080 [Alosa alosa]